MANKFFVPEGELNFEFARSGGPGGQNVNKTSTKATVRWNISRSAVLSVAQKSIIRKVLKNKITVGDDLIVSSGEERSQFQNRAKAVERLRSLVQKAMAVPKPRRRTTPTFSSKQKRLQNKKIRSALKRERKRVE